MIWSAVQCQCSWRWPHRLCCFSYCCAAVDAEQKDTRGWAWGSLPNRPLDFGQSPPGVLSLECAMGLAGAGGVRETPLVQVQERRPRASAGALLRGRNDGSYGCILSCCFSPPRTGCSAAGSNCSAASAAHLHLAAGPMELADTGGGKSGEIPVGAAAVAGTLGSVAAGIGSAAAADERLAAAQAFAVETAAAEVAAAAPRSVAAGSVAVPAAAAAAAVVDIASVFQLAPVGNVAAAADDDFAARAVAFGELVAAQTAAGALLAVAAGKRTAAEPVGPPSACCWTGCLRSAGSFPPPGSPLTPPR